MHLNRQAKLKFRNFLICGGFRKWSLTRRDDCNHCACSDQFFSRVTRLRQIRNRSFSRAREYSASERLRGVAGFRRLL
jgi:hypothetical protein